MKVITLLLILAITAIACHSTKTSSVNDTNPPKIAEAENDTTQYELIIYDIRFNSYLATQPPMEHYSNNYYKTWNIQYVTEWNYRHLNPIKYGNFYETHIDYSPHIDYGIELNYKLYYYFLFIEKEYGIRLVQRAKTAR